ncbi:fimbrial biogenesis outer membrane usher protein [Pseudomonas sp. 7P_10.2_Bac1]|uniref:fimbria/pilus outer membrane usher protein n=1 Tax=Pseudomonas sp. 7P_10.2_Bac1 TaxID=2971614 RepID=UPI0021CA023B|nr:fimbria/pilus outer membrane usher protein [Pseudomonas sp. 7P_10.2_Bac1]MCU1729405.1 fimbrial biogenesis outer membrane usher protein [Pseudomonas sp. 7P_10.2_Bac1]
MIDNSFTRGTARSYDVLILLILSGYSASVISEDYFEPNAIDRIPGQHNSIDLSSLTRTGAQPPGTYHTYIYLNGSLVETRNIVFTAKDDTLHPQISKEDLVNWGVFPEATTAFMQMHNGVMKESISAYLPDSSFVYDFAQQKLNLSIPQIYIKKAPRGEVPSSEWNHGINSAIINYNYSGSNSWIKHGSGDNQNHYLNVRSGVNFNEWRLRNYSAWSSTEDHNSWRSLTTYVQRDVTSLKSQLTLGESYTPSEVFDSFAFRGAQLYSSDAMMPQSLRGFAPVIRGIAQTNAQITIRQGGNTIYQSYVPPGPFLIDDLYPTSASGELHVSIKEANGEIRTFTQAFSAVPVMQREGRLKYSLAVGRYRSSAGSNDKNPSFSQITGLYGLPHATTLYGGNIYSDKYSALSVGIGKGIGDLGSISLDSTFAKTELPDKTKNGGSFRFQYSKDFLASGTSLALSGYRYSTSGYYDFNEANGYYSNHPSAYGHEAPADTEEDLRKFYQWRDQFNKRSKSQLEISQTLGGYGSLYVSAYQQSYWGVSGNEKNINIGYNGSFRSASYFLNYSESSSLYNNNKDKIVSLSLQIPFDRLLSNSWVNFSASNNNHGDSMASVGVSGNALADKQLSYNVQQRYDSQDHDVAGSASVDYRAKFGQYQAGYNYTTDSQQLNYGASGGIVVHPYGLTVSQPLGDTLALVKADKAENIKVSNNVGIYTDSGGYAVVPYVSPYQRNTLQLDTASLPNNVDILNTTSTVVPTEGALVLADFQTKVGAKMLITLKTQTLIPFGATAQIIENGNSISSGIVDAHQQVYLSGAPQKGQINVIWSSGKCDASFDTQNNKDRVKLVTAYCQ